MKTTSFLVIVSAMWAAPGEAPADPAAVSYAIVGTGQMKCYNNTGEIPPPKQGEPFYGQDAQFRSRAADYTITADQLTVHDNVTGLTWQSSPDTNGDGKVDSRDKLTFSQALEQPAKLNSAKFGGFDDWRLPTIKELYSLILFSGEDVSGPNMQDTSRQTPFIDTRFFKFAYGDVNAGERTIDSQWATRTTYVADSGKMFGVNFADGRIKGYGTTMPGRGEKTFFVLCVRGNPNYGVNGFLDNHDGTISDSATGLMWSQADSGKGMNWQDALAWVQRQNAAKYLGHDDWRLPNAKELQSIVDYTRSPDTTRSAAIDPLFRSSNIINEGGKKDYPFYWTGTTHAGIMGGQAAVYVSFGRAAGWMPAHPMTGGPSGSPGGRPPAGPPARPPSPGGPPPSGAAGNLHFTDVHGAGSQRSDPKTGDPKMFPRGRGPQGDVIRINNYVRLVRGGSN